VIITKGLFAATPAAQIISVLALVEPEISSDTCCAEERDVHKIWS
jgi:hypothetical protein